MDTSLVGKHCEPCHAGTPRLRGDELQTYAQKLGDHWRVEDEHHLVASFSFPDFEEALRFTNRVGSLAEAEGHHPEIRLTWGEATVRIWTHAIDGLSENDFILAARIDELDR
ncbi:MAG: 4a-hydroxytetrahydrobiopterin dehydratase [Gemmatimonadota bacterium]